MAGSIEKLKAQLVKAEAATAKAEAAKKKALRQAQLVMTQLGKQERRIDTRRKILVGAWAFDRAGKSRDFHAAMHDDLNRSWLVRDDDRAMFGLEPLSEAEKAARGFSPAQPRQRARKASAVASAAHSDSSADATAQEKESEAA